MPVVPRSPIETYLGDITHREATERIIGSHFAVLKGFLSNVAGLTWHQNAGSEEPWCHVNILPQGGKEF